MKRFFGMMPSSEVEIIKTFKSDNSGSVTVEACPHGWTIMFADYSSRYQDVDDTSENNFNQAINVLKEIFEDFENRFKESDEQCEEIEVDID